MEKRFEGKPEVKMYCNDGESRLLWDKSNEPGANTILSECPICRKIHRRRKTNEIPVYETYLQLRPYRGSWGSAEMCGLDPFHLCFTVWIRRREGLQVGDRQTFFWQKGGEYNVRLDIFDATLNEGRGGYVRNPLLDHLHWHSDRPDR